MIYSFRSVAIIGTFAGVFAGWGLHGCQSPPAPVEPAELDDAKLDAQVAELRAARKVEDAVAVLERSLARREIALGSSHPSIASRSSELAALHRERAAYGKAEPLLVRALELRERLLGPTDLDVAQSLNDLGTLHLDQGAHGKAEPLLGRALDIREHRLGHAHPTVAQSLNDLAELHRAQGAYSKAESLCTRALDIREAALGPRHPDVAQSLNTLAEIHRYQGAYAKAQPLYARALEIREAALGPVHRDVARTLGNLAELYRMQGEYEKAEPLYTRALEVAERALGAMHPEVAQGLNNLAILYWTRREYWKAEPLHVRALELRENMLGPMHTDVARSLNNLALVYQDQGSHGRAEPLYVRALDIHEKAFGPNHDRVASILNNLATLYLEQGAYDKAEPLLVRAVEIAEGALGPQHADVAQSLSNLAQVHHVQGRYAKAEPLYVRALQIAERALGELHPDVAAPLTSLAWLYRDQQAHDKAEPLLVRALAIRQSAHGPEHVAATWAMLNLAALYRDRRAYAKAEPLVLRALAIREQALGPAHPELARALTSVAKLYWARGSHRSAAAALSRAADIREDQLRIELPRLPEPRKRALMTFLQVETDSLVSLHAHAQPRSRHALELALTNILRRKGRILDSLVGNETALRAHLSPELRDQLDQLDRARGDLVAQLYASRGATDRGQVAATRARIEKLEAALSAASAELRLQAEPITVAKIQAALPPDAVLVEFVRYHRFDPRRVQHVQEARYIAYVLGAHGAPQWIALGPAAPIDAEVDAVLAAMDDKVATGTAKAALRRLDAAVLAPIRRRLTGGAAGAAGVSHLILAPDGKLNLIPFEALVDSQGRHALESYLMSYVTTGRDLLRLAARRVMPRSAATIVAGPEYGPPAQAGAVSFPPLANALGEADDLVGYFAAPPLTGARATKSALKALTGPAMLHIATHGFYARGVDRRPPPSPGQPTREMFVDRNAAVLPPPTSDDPAEGLDRAGLAMAGANQGAVGIVTAREIAGFDWWGTELVVLSACETGVGAVASGDGVYGLRRALVLAGTAAQVISLWNVDDASTRALMRDYYAELAQAVGRAEALRRAKLRLMRQPRYVHPHFWAAFIPAGDWRSLAQNTIVRLHHAP